MTINSIILKINEKVKANALSTYGSQITPVKERDLPIVWTSEPEGIVSLYPSDTGYECDIEAVRIGSTVIKIKAGRLTSEAIVHVNAPGADALAIEFGNKGNRGD